MAADSDLTQGGDILNAASYRCPVCQSDALEMTVERSQLPAMQNYVYRTAEQARSAKVGRLSLAVCRNCGFAFNREFTAELLDYDQGYDNSVPSTVMASYYETLCRHLNETYLHDEGLIVDVGCGKGTFLQTMIRMYPCVRGLGIDPSYEGPLQDATGSLKFIRKEFAEDQLAERPSLVICRHVMEHMSRPVDFLKSLHTAVQAYPNVPFFVEVPDLGWIIQNQAFWDFCFEHCNYFTPLSLTNAMTMSGFRTVQTRTAYGDQYIWLESYTESAISTSTVSESDVLSLTNRVRTYTESERLLIQQSLARLNQLKNDGWVVVLWGMATKGILFSYLVDARCTIFDHCIDINRNKQGCFTPVTGHAISSPDVLTAKSSSRMAIVVMNTNYLSEIAATCRGCGLDPLFLNANGETLPV